MRYDCDYGSLEDSSDETQDTSKTNSSDLDGTSSGDGAGSGGRSVGGSRGGAGHGVVGVGRGVHGSTGRYSGASVADDAGGRVDRLADGARAVGDGECGGLGHGIGLTTVSDLGSSRAVGGVGGNDLSGVCNVGSIAVRGLGASGQSNSSSDGELHFD